MAAHNLVGRALDIIVYLADHHDGRSVTAIAEDTGIPASAVHRLLGTLVEKGIVQQDARSRDYALSIVLPALGLRYLSGLSFVDACRPVMDDLAASTKELVRLAVVDGDDLVWIAKAQGSRSSLRLDPLEGRKAALHLTAAGKAWLAALPDEQVAKRFPGLLRAAKGLPLGPNAIVQVDQFLADLAVWRRKGYAVTYEEAEPGIAAIGAVVRAGVAPEAPVVATISVAGPTVRIPRQDIEPLGQAVSRAAAELSAIWPATHHLMGNAHGPTRNKRARDA